MLLELPLILFGAGGVGRTLLRQILANRALHRHAYGLRINVLAVCDSTGAAVELGGIDDANLMDLIELKEAGGGLADHVLGSGTYSDALETLHLAGRVGTVVVDVTASETTVPALLYAREQGHKIVLANKKPLTVHQEVYTRLTRAGETKEQTATWALHASRWETTVGAGLPVIATLNRLLASGDRVTRIDGTFSGTLGYVMTGLQEGRRLSTIVREAHKLGYTEPDPRDDLGGVDVARKALILARGIGWQLDLEDVAVTGLYPDTMADLTVPEFLDALEQLDDEYAVQVANAHDHDHVLRFAATLVDGTCTVGPAVVPTASPLGRLNGTDNLVEFHSQWYHPNPLVIQGRGAGVEATAAGVLSDIVELAFTK